MASVAPLCCCWAAASSRPPGESRGRPASRQIGLPGSADGSRPLCQPRKRHTSQLGSSCRPPRARSRQRNWRCAAKAPGRGAPPSAPYRGEPGRCAVYAARRSHYWKQVLSRLRRKRRPCRPRAAQGPPVRRQEGPWRGAALVPQAFPVVTPKAAAGLTRDPKPRAGSRGRPEPALGPVAGAPPLRKRAARGSPLSRSPKGAKRKAAWDPDEERPLGTGPDPDGLDGD